MPGQKLILGIVAIIIIAILGIFLTPMRYSFFGMKGTVGFIGAHTTASIEDSSDVGYMRIRDFLSNNGYEIKQIQAPTIRAADLQTVSYTHLRAHET